MLEVKLLKSLNSLVTCCESNKDNIDYNTLSAIEEANNIIKQSGLDNIERLEEIITGLKRYGRLNNEDIPLVLFVLNKYLTKLNGECLG